MTFLHVSHIINISKQLWNILYTDLYSGRLAQLSALCAPELYVLFYVCMPSTYSRFVQQLHEGVKTTDLGSSVDLLPGLMNNLQTYVELSYKSLSEQCIQEFPWELVAMNTSSYQASLPG